MGYYDKIQTVPVGGQRRDRLGVGKYEIAVTCVREHAGKTGGTFFVIEGIVQKSTNAEHPVGSEASTAIRLDVPFPDMALSEVKAFCAAALGVEPSRVDEEITPAVVKGILSDKQPLTGQVVAADVWVKQPGPKSRPGTQPFNKVSWSRASGAPKTAAVEWTPPAGWVKMAGGAYAKDGMSLTREMLEKLIAVGAA